MSCSDLIVLQRLLDNDLDAVEAELVAHHVSSCDQCRVATATLAESRAFAENQLGAEDEREEEAATAALARIAAHLPLRKSEPAATWWRRVMLAATFAGLALLVPLPFGPAMDASPGRILEEAAARERMWMYQPNRILHWEIATDMRGLKNVPDGMRRTMFWQKNGAATFQQISRQLDSQGRVEHAWWQRHDGSTVSFRSRNPGIVEVGPTTEDAEAVLPTLPQDLRDSLKGYLSHRESARTLDFYGRRYAEWLHRPARWTSYGKATLRRATDPRWGDVYRITVENGPSPTNAEIRRAVHEYEVETSTFRLLRLKSTLTYSDGSTGFQDARWIVYREISAAEFDAQTPRDLLDGDLQIVNLTPRQVAERRIREIGSTVRK